MKLLNQGNAKTLKGEVLGYRTFGLHLSPSDKSGFNVCKWASKGCRSACLDTAGRGCMSNVQTSRINKTKRFFKNKFVFMSDIRVEICKAIISAAKKQSLEYLFSEIYIQKIQREFSQLKKVIDLNRSLQSAQGLDHNTHSAFNSYWQATWGTNPNSISEQFLRAIINHSRFWQRTLSACDIMQLPEIQ